MIIPLQPCYILHKRSYRESSLILHVFSKHHGLVDLLVKGAKRANNRQRYMFRPYQRLLISWYSRTELGLLAKLEADAPAIQLRPQQLMSGFYMNETLLRLLQKQEPQPDFFDYYEHTLLKLASGGLEKIALRYFEKRLLQILGYGLNLDREAHSGKQIQDKDHYYYQFDLGPLASPPSSGSAHIAISGQALRKLKQETILASDDKALHQEIKSLMRAILGQYLGNKPMNSRLLYQAYTRQAHR